jgi:single-stranded DNA-specific DHH superfamily exonuclease
MIPNKQIQEIRKALEKSARPLVFFDDDPDGLCSFLQFYKLNPESKGIIYKVAGPLDERFLKKVKEYSPDTIFILDIAEVSQDFLDKVNNVYWIDHHSPSGKKNVNYYNPMIKSKGKDNRPISYWAHKITKVSPWLALVGCVGDWFLPKDIIKELDDKELLPLSIKTPEDALFKTKTGHLARIFSFIIKGTSKDAMKNTKILTRIKDPFEILEQSTSQGKYIWKQFQKFNSIYEQIYDSIKYNDDNLIVHTYSESKTSLTSDLSNEILYNNPEKFIIICRENNGEMKCSLRSSKYEVLPILKKALKGLEGFGGGHEHACGCNVKKKDFSEFIDRIRKQL